MSVSSKLRTLGHLSRGVVAHGLQALRAPVNVASRNRAADVAHLLGVFPAKPLLARVAPEALVDQKVPLSITQPHTEEWQVSLVELATIVGLAMKRGATSIFEFGTFDGRTTLNLSENLPGAKMRTLDMPPGSKYMVDDKQPGELIRRHVETGRIEQLFGNSLSYDFSSLRGTCDFVFIDAGHSYECAYSDSLNALRLTEGREAAIVWHDYPNIAEVTRAVHDVRSVVTSNVRWVWPTNTHLAVMLCAEGEPLKHRAG